MKRHGFAAEAPERGLKRENWHQISARSWMDDAVQRPNLLRLPGRIWEYQQGQWEHEKSAK